MLKRFNYHFKISMLKSVVRIMGIVLGMTTKNLELLCSLFLVAELLGIFEEFENDENWGEVHKLRKIFILNGAAESGKDKFVELVNQYALSMHYSYVLNSKKAATEYFGWSGGKTERDRKFLADLNTLSSEYNDYPFQDVKSLAVDFAGGRFENVQFLFIDAREVSAIDRMKQEFRAETIFVHRKGVEPITSNHADMDVKTKYDYDYYIENDGSIEDLDKVAKEFVNYIKERK